MSEQKKGMGILGTVFEKALGSDKLWDYVANAGMGDLLNEIFKTPGLKDKIMEPITEMAEDMKEAFDITKWEYVVDRDENMFYLNLYTETEKLRIDFKSRFKMFLEDLRQNYKGAFDAFIKLYKVSEIGCDVVDYGISMRVVTERVDDLEKVLVELSTANMDFEGGGGKKDE